MSEDRPAVEVERVDGSREVALIDSFEKIGTDEYQQERVELLTVRDGDVITVNTAAERVREVEGQEADLARDIIEPKLEGSA